jgi:putative transposase
VSSGVGTLKGTEKSSRRIRRLTRCRHQKIDNYLHRASRYLVNLLVELEITTLVIGKNPGWKQKVKLGKVNNQSFVPIPHSRLIDMITYKCQLVGIKVILQEESYTSPNVIVVLPAAVVTLKSSAKPIISILISSGLNTDNSSSGSLFSFQKFGYLNLNAK